MITFKYRAVRVRSVLDLLGASENRAPAGGRRAQRCPLAAVEWTATRPSKELEYLIVVFFPESYRRPVMNRYQIVVSIYGTRARS
jgi:hypothetical protein